MKITLTDINPAMAKLMLQANTHNRPLSDKAMTDYSRDMAAGNWVSNGETIKIAEDGFVIDGQHRLAAVVKSGATLYDVIVVEGLPAHAQDTVDIGRRRTVSDIFSLAGETNSGVLAAVTRKTWLWERGIHKFTNTMTPTVTELQEFLEEFPSLRRSAEIGKRCTNHYRPLRAAVTGTSHHIFLQIDPDLTAEFFARLETGADLAEGHPVLTLRNRMAQDKLTSKAVPFHLGVALYIRAWNGLR